MAQATQFSWCLLFTKRPISSESIWNQFIREIIYYESRQDHWTTEVFRIGQVQQPEMPETVVTTLRKHLVQEDVDTALLAAKFLSKYKMLSTADEMALVTKLLNDETDYKDIPWKQFRAPTTFEHLFQLLKSVKKSRAIHLLLELKPLPGEVLEGIVQGLICSGNSPIESHFLYLLSHIHVPDLEARFAEKVRKYIRGITDRSVAVKVVSRLLKQAPFEPLAEELKEVLEPRLVRDSHARELAGEAMNALQTSSTLPRSICQVVARWLGQDDQKLRLQASLLLQVYRELGLPEDGRLNPESMLRKYCNTSPIHDWIDSKTGAALHEAFKTYPLDVAVAAPLLPGLLGKDVSARCDWVIAHINSADIDCEVPRQGYGSLRLIDLLYELIFYHWGPAFNEEFQRWNEIEHMILTLWDNKGRLGSILRLKPSSEPKLLIKLISRMQDPLHYRSCRSAIDGRPEATPKLIEVLCRVSGSTCVAYDWAFEHIEQLSSTEIYDLAKVMQKEGPRWDCNKEAVARLLSMQNKLPINAVNLFMHFADDWFRFARRRGYSTLIVQHFCRYSEYLDSGAISHFLRNYPADFSRMAELGQITAIWLDGDYLHCFAPDGSPKSYRLGDERRFRAKLEHAQNALEVPVWARIKLY